MNSTAESNLVPTRTNMEADQGARTLKSCYSRSERTFTNNLTMKASVA